MLAAGWLYIYITYMLSISIYTRMYLVSGTPGGERLREMRRAATGFGWRHGNGVARLIKPRCRNRRKADRRAARCRYLAPAKCGRCSSHLVCFAAACFALAWQQSKPRRAPDGRCVSTL